MRRNANTHAHGCAISVADGFGGAEVEALNGIRLDLCREIGHLLILIVRVVKCSISHHLSVAVSESAEAYQSVQQFTIVVSISFRF